MKKRGLYLYYRIMNHKAKKPSRRTLRNSEHLRPQHLCRSCARNHVLCSSTPGNNRHLACHSLYNFDREYSHVCFSRPCVWTMQPQPNECFSTHKHDFSICRQGLALIISRSISDAPSEFNMISHTELSQILIHVRHCKRRILRLLP